MNRHFPSWLSGVTGALMLSACAGSPPATYYTLLAAAGSGTGDAVGADADIRPDQRDATRGSFAGGLARGGAGNAVIEVLPVSVPVQVDQPQIMLRDTAGAVTPQYSERWAAPLADEMRSALSDRLTRQLGVADVYEVKPARGQPVWRIQVDVQRFDSMLGEAAIVDATWRVRAINMQAPTALCRTSIRQPTDGPGVNAIVAAHQRAVGVLGEVIAARVAGRSIPATAGATTQCTQISDASAG